MRRVSAAVAEQDDRKTPMPIDTPNDQTAQELTNIKKEVIEARNLVIKTDHLLKSFHAELKAVAKQQEDFARKQLISSAVAYVLFAALAIGGAVAYTGARTSSVTSDRERLEKQVTELATQLDGAKRDAASGAQARQSAADVYRMMTTLPGDERLKGVDALVKLDTSKLSPLEKSALTDRATLLRKEVGDVAFERGKAAFRRTDMNETAEQLSRFLAMNPAEPDALEASFYLGVAYNQLKKHAEAVPLLNRYVESGKRGKNHNYAMALLAHSLENTNQMERAAQVARDGLGTYPDSEFAGMLKVRLSAAKRAQAVANGEPATAPAAAPAAAPTATTAAPAGQ
jgi:TolA-binding protein